jgi:hypothetical protein
MACPLTVNCKLILIFQGKWYPVVSKDLAEEIELSLKVTRVPIFIVPS